MTATLEMPATPSLNAPLVEVLFGGKMKFWAYPNVAQCRPNPQNKDSFQRVVDLARTSNLNKILVAQMEFRDNICGERDLETSHFFPGISIRTGAKADGIVLSSGWSAAMFTADCLAIFVWGNKTRTGLMLHGGRDALVNKEYIKDEYNDSIPVTKLRKHKRSIVHRAIALLKEKGNQPEDIHIASRVGIQADNFIHRRDVGSRMAYYGKLHNYLKRLYGYSCFDEGDGLDLHKLTKRQAMSDGVPGTQISSDKINTFDDPWASVRRNPSENNRNVIFASLI